MYARATSVVLSFFSLSLFEIAVFGDGGGLHAESSDILKVGQYAVQIRVLAR